MTKEAEVYNCPVCAQGVNQTTEQHRQLKGLAPGQTEPRPDDPIVGYVHEVCALRQEMQQLHMALAGKQSMIASILSNLGGAIVVNKDDIERAAALGNEIEIVQHPDTRVELKLRRQIIFGARAAPRLS